MLSFLLLLLVFSTVQTSPSQFRRLLKPRPAIELTSEDNQSFRLPNNTYPLRYDLYLTSNIHLDDENPEKFNFNGKVAITVKVLETSRFITLHFKQIEIVSSRIFKEQGEECKIVERKVDEARDFVTFRVDRYLYKDETIQLTIEYAGVLREDSAGFFRNSYVNAQGERKWLAATQFQMIDARHAFPCYDEPQIRSVYGVTIQAHESLEVLSNMPIKSKTLTGGRMIATTFEDTPLTHSYLVAFVISDFLFVGQNDTSEKPLRVYGRPEAILNHEGDFALATAQEILQFQQSYFDVSFDLPKMDNVAIPDFLYLAMENWGLVTYRENFLLYDDQKPDLSNKHYIATLMAHEYGHQFFGNLLAPNFWHYYWLNEGFATFCEMEFVSAIYPEFHTKDYYVASTLQFSMENDATEETRPMTTFVDNPIELYAPSGFVVYHKAASVLRMLQLALGPETFRKGVSYYLQANKYGAVDSDDLAKGLEKAAREDQVLPRSVYMKDVIDSWALQAHYPLVEVSMDHKNRIALTQRQFSYDMSHPSKATWVIPVTIATESVPQFEKTTPVLWWGSESTAIERTEELHWFEDDWVVVNVQEMGHFRVTYEDRMWRRLIRKLQSDSFTEIHHVNRAQLIDDALALARAGLLPYYVALQVTEYLSQEQHFLPLMSASKGFEYINLLLSDSRSYELLKAFFSELFLSKYEELGVEDLGKDEPLMDKTKRNIAVNWVCLTGNEACTKETSTRVQEALREPEKEIPADLRSAVYCNGLRKADQELFSMAWDKAVSSQESGYRETILGALGCVENSDLQNEYLNSTLAKDAKYREYEKIEVLNAVSKNGGRNGVENTISFLEKNFKEIEVAFFATLRPTKTACLFLADRVTSSKMYEKYQGLLQKVAEEGLISESEREQYSRAAMANVEWVGRNEDDIEQFLKDFFSTRPV